MTAPQSPERGEGRLSAEEVEAMLADLPTDATYVSDLDAFDQVEVHDEPLTPDQRQRFIAAADRPLKVRRLVLLLAAHATGGHLKNPHGESCKVCKERWPCVTVRRAAGPALDAFAECGGIYSEADLARREREAAERAWEEGRAAGHRELRPINAFGDTEPARNPYRAALASGRAASGADSEEGQR